MSTWHTAIRMMGGAAALAVLASPASAGQTGYIKIPDIPGESQRKADSGARQLDYLVITMERVSDEHEMEYDILAATSAKARPEIAGVTWGAVKPKRQTPRDAATGLPTGKRTHTTTRDAASGLATGKRQHKPLTTTKQVDKADPHIMTAAVRWRGCAVGRTYDHVLLGDGEGKEHRLDGVRVAHCGREHVSFTYDKIS